jgi:hypothetical protein
MKAILSRTYNQNETLGSLLVFSGHEIKYRCKTIELPENGNQHNTSCIPEGVYDVIKMNHPDKGMCFRILNVPNRDGILIHKGNYAAGNHVDTLGCILPGSCFIDLNEDGSLDIAESTKTMNELLAILPQSFKLHIL